MDRPYSHAHSESSPPLLPSAQTSHSDVFTIETSPTRQQRLLQNRNARFPAKKLSISGLSNKLTQLVGNNDTSSERNAPTRNQENKLHKSRSTGTIGKKGSLAVLEEISNTARGRSFRKRSDISIYKEKDNAERPLLETSPLVASSPQINLESRFDFTSPINLDHIQDSFNDMRLRDRSFDNPWSPINRSPPSSLRIKSRKRSAQANFNADEYIEHIENELQQIRDEVYSPLTRRPMKEKLRAANKENERLQNELSQLKEAFEAEVKRTVEHKTLTEVELKRRVRDLEDSLEEKDQTIRDLQHHHEDKRLDDSVIDSLKATIERLEFEKQDMEEINLSMNKRNEVLTQLLAMSPTRNPSGFNLSSPVREKRNGRPFSLIIPKQPLSPKPFSQANSVACSPHPISSSAISPFKLSPSTSNEGTLNAKFQLAGEAQQPDLQQADLLLRSPRVQDSISRRWTILSDASAASNSGNDDPKPLTRRKTRKFVAGSTQLRPLLLPTLTGESMYSASLASSPRSVPADLEYAADLDDTVLPINSANELLTPDHEDEDTSKHMTSLNMSFDAEEGPGPEIPQNAELRTDVAALEDHPELMPSSHGLNGLGLPSLDYAGYDVISPRRGRQLTMDSMQMMPMPSTPDSLAALPAPLFSPPRHLVYHQPPVGLTSPEDLVSIDAIHMSKKRKSVPADSPDSSPRHKVPRHSEYYAEQSYSIPPSLMGAPNTHEDPRSLTDRLRKVRSSDNVLEILRTKNFAAKPLAALTIKTVYQIVSSAAKTARDFKRDPFALARKMLANAWFMNWKMLGKVSWWVLGLFFQPQNTPRVRPPIDWDEYDGESIASRYCRSDVGSSDVAENDDEVESTSSSLADARMVRYVENRPVVKNKPGWTQSMFLWGKFSAAMMLAVSGAVVHGPGEMLKDIQKRSSSRPSRHKLCESCGAAKATSRAAADGRIHGSESILTQNSATRNDIFQEHSSFHLDDTELDSSSILQQIRQTELDSTLKPTQPSRPPISSLFTPLSSP